MIISREIDYIEHSSFSSNFYRQTVGILMSTNCSPLVEDPIFMLSFNEHAQADVIEAFNSTSRYLDVLLNIDYTAGKNSPRELQLNIVNSTETEAPNLDFFLSILKDNISSKIYDKKR